MQLTLVDGLPFVPVILVYLGQQINLDRVLVDTGSATTVFAADSVAEYGLRPFDSDPLYTMYGIGGTELVFGKLVESLRVGDAILADVEVQVGALDYGIELQGILGMNFLLSTRGVIDLGALDLSFPRAG